MPTTELRPSSRELGAVTLTVSLLVGACLGEPEPRSRAPFPPQESIEIHTAQVLDVNDDGRDDILLAALGPENARGVYILLGGASGVGAHYHAFVNTARTAPLAFALSDMAGTEDPELMVFGAEAERSHLLLFEGQGHLTFAEQPWINELTDTIVPSASNRREWMRHMNFDGDGDPDLVVGTDSRLYTAELSPFTVSAFEDIQFERVLGPNSTSFYGPTNLDMADRNDDSVPDLIVVDHFSTYTLFGDRSGGFAHADGSSERNTYPLSSFDFSGLYDLNGDGALDVLGSVSNWIGAIAPWPVDQSFRAPGRVFDDIGQVIDFQVAQLDADAEQRPEVIILEDQSATAPAGTLARLMVLENIYIDASEPPGLISNTSRLDYIFDAEFMPQRVLPGDFDGDGLAELMFFDSAGHSRCIALRPGAALEACP